MTTLGPETLVNQDADLLRRLQQVLSGHPAGGAFRLMLAPTAVEIADDEALIQTVNPTTGTIELHPRKLADVTLADVLHATQVIDPADEEFRSYAASPMALSCHGATAPGGKRIHGYH
ncbi:hypothetical protein [Streptomyces sp. NPDC021020]|uniref:hypothetical protein n=1 Tax=Streptomyces sp. NPDC021020 TaxID=3365109 RepID=UPI0037903E98